MSVKRDGRAPKLGEVRLEDGARIFVYGYGESRRLVLRHGDITFTMDLSAEATHQLALLVATGPDADIAAGRFTRYPDSESFLASFDEPTAEGKA